MVGIKRIQISVALMALLLCAVVLLGTVKRNEKLQTEEAAREKPSWEIICKNCFADEYHDLIIADSELPGAYCAALFASKTNAPLLFTDDLIACAKEADRLKSKTVYLLTSEERCDEIKAVFDQRIDFIFMNAVDASEISTNLASMYSASPEAVFVTNAQEGAGPIAAASGISVTEGYPIIAANDGGLDDTARNYLTNDLNLKAVYVMGNASDDTNTFLGELNVDIIRIDAKDPAVMNAALISDFYENSQRAVVASSAADAVLYSTAVRENPILYVPDVIRAEQVSYLSEHSIQDITGSGEDNPVLLQSRRILRSISEQTFAFENDQCKGAIFFVPHQDDETLYYSQVITCAIDTYGADNVYLVLISDGAASGVKKREEVTAPIMQIVSATGLPVAEIEMDSIISSFFSRARTNEMLDAVHELGLTNQPEIHYFKDGTLDKNIDGIMAVMKDYAERVDGRMMMFSFSPYYDFHSDHRAVGEALYLLHEEDETGLFGHVRFIARGEEEFNECFLDAPEDLMREHFCFFKNQSGNERILKALQCYGKTDSTVDEIASDIIQIVKDRNCSISAAVIDSEKADLLRLGIGHKSVPEAFQTLNERTRHNGMITYIHDPFDIELYGGIDHE